MSVIFNEGDIVHVKSGGPLMTIKWAEGTDVICVWFEGKNKKERRFPRKHGHARATFKTSAEEATFPNGVIEAALAHAIGDKVEAASGTRLEQRW